MVSCQLSVVSCEVRETGILKRECKFKKDVWSCPDVTAWLNIWLLYIVMLIEDRHQGLTAEKSSAQKPNQGEWTNVLNIICP